MEESPKPKYSIAFMRKIQERKLLVYIVAFQGVYNEFRNELSKRLTVVSDDVFARRHGRGQHGEQLYTNGMLLDQVRDLFCIRFNIGYMEHNYRIKLLEYKLAVQKQLSTRKAA